MKYIIPRIASDDVPPMICVALVGGILAGIYGIVHDQITYWISPEYFTKLKFDQFWYADFGHGDRVFASTIGFLATWWVGFIAAWFLARRLIPRQPRDQAFRQIRKGIMCIITFGSAFGVAGYGYGLWRGPDADYSSWTWAFRELKVTDTWSFVRVAYIHNAGYLGGLIGLVVALRMIRPVRDEAIDCGDRSKAGPRDTHIANPIPGRRAGIYVPEHTVTQRLRSLPAKRARVRSGRGPGVVAGVVSLLRARE